MANNQENINSSKQNAVYTDNFSKSGAESGAWSDTSAQIIVKSGQNNENSAQNRVNSELNINKNSPQNIAKKPKTGDPVSVIQDVSNNSAENLDPKSSVLSQNDDDALFSSLFPGMTREKVENDELFKLFMRSRREGAPLSLAYSEYRALLSKIEEHVLAKEAARLANKQSAVGSLASNEPSESSFYTKEQVLKMSREQIKRNYDKIRQSQSNW